MSTSNPVLEKFLAEKELQRKANTSPFFEEEVTILGIGGGALNVLAYMRGAYRKKNFKYVICNSDKIGLNYAESIGLQFWTWEDNPSILDSYLQGCKHLIVFSAFGGTLGSTVTPILVARAKEMGIRMDVVVTIPNCDLEGETRTQVATDAVAILKELVPNMQVFNLSDCTFINDYPLREGFKAIDRHILWTCISPLLSRYYRNDEEQ